MAKKETLNKTLNSAVKGLIDRLEKTESFIIDQAPEICKQMVYDKCVENKINLINYSFLTVLMLVTACVSGSESYHSIASGKVGADGYQFICFLLSLGSGITSLIFISEFLLAIQWLIYLKKCPKLFLLREFRNLIKE
jgi:hypothetical protein